MGVGSILRPLAGLACVETLPRMDLNHVKQSQSLLCYRYTTVYQATDE